MSTKRRNQHIVPSLCLDYFTDAKGHVWTYTKKGRSWHRRPQDTAKIAHFYSVERADGTMDTNIEDILSRIESDASEPYRTLVSGRLIYGDDKANFARFLGAQVSRTQATRRVAAKINAMILQNYLHVTASHDAAFKEMVNRLREDGIKIENEEEVRDSFSDLSKFKISIAKEFLLPSMAVRDKLAEIFEYMKWSLWKPERHYFITCDNPVFRAADPTTYHPILGDHGYLNKTAQVTFPLSPRLLLLMTYEYGDTPFIHTMDRKYVYIENEKRAFAAENEIYAHLEDKRVAKLARMHRRSRPDVLGGTFAGSKSFHSVEVPRRRNRKVT